MTARLNRSNHPAGHQIGVSAPSQTGIVHLGLGNFHRAHAADFTARALAQQPGDWGIVGVANRSHSITSALADQDYLYTILELSAEGERADLVDVHRRTLVAADQPQEVVASLADPRHKIVTLTLTEAGYRTKGTTGRLDLDAPDIVRDLAQPDQPQSMIGIIGAGLIRRHAGGGAPLTILSCDNMLSAGHTARSRITEYLAAAQVPDEVMDWLAGQVSFPNAMVDRIVPATTEATKDRVAQLLGYRDEAPVPAEKFTMWVLEDHFAAGRPAWEQAGAIFTNEVERYELVKLRLLNGCYSLISYLGVLAGEDTNPGAIQTPWIADCVRTAQYNEYLPTIDLPSGFDADAYIDQLFERWGNWALADKTWRVASDGSAKLPQRIPEPALRAIARGYVPQQMALTAAGWIAAACPPAGFDPGPIAAKAVEPKLAVMQAAAESAHTIRQHAQAILQAGILPAELVAQSAFTDRVADLLEIIVNHGVQAAAEEALAAGQPV